MSAPVKTTCPDIDKAIRSIRAAIKVAKEGRKQHPEADDYFWDILYNIEDLEGPLEDLRNSNASLRDWGDSLEEELRSSASIIAELENKFG